MFVSVQDRCCPILRLFCPLSCLAGYYWRVPLLLCCCRVMMRPGIDASLLCHSRQAPDMYWNSSYSLCSICSIPTHSKWRNSPGGSLGSFKSHGRYGKTEPLVGRQSHRLLLTNNPVSDPVEVSFLIAQVEEVRGLQSEPVLPAADDADKGKQWRHHLPFLRLMHCKILNDVKDAFLHRVDRASVSHARRAQGTLLILWKTRMCTIAFFEKAP